MKAWFCIPILVSLAACATAPKSAMNTGKKDVLSARTLAPGDCGLFVWTADETKKFILFTQSQGSLAVWVGDAGEQNLTVSEQGGTPTEGQYPEQSYDDGALKLVLREPQAITQGTRYRAGTFTRMSEAGWSRVTPVVGLSACQPG